MPYKFTEQAENDFDGIIQHTLENWGKNQAVNYVEGLEELLEKLVLMPTLGIKKDDLFKNLFAFGYVSHVVYYATDSGGITVIRILHKRMDAKRHILELDPTLKSH